MWPEPGACRPLGVSQGLDGGGGDRLERECHPLGERTRLSGVGTGLLRGGHGGRGPQGEAPALQFPRRAGAGVQGVWTRKLFETSLPSCSGPGALPSIKPLASGAGPISAPSLVSGGHSQTSCPGGREDLWGRGEGQGGREVC